MCRPWFGLIWIGFLVLAAIHASVMVRRGVTNRQVLVVETEPAPAAAAGLAPES